MTRTIEERAVLGWSIAFSAGGAAMSWALVSPRFAGSLALGAVLGFRSESLACRTRTN